jgi:hypothetical protein
MLKLILPLALLLFSPVLAGDWSPAAVDSSPLHHPTFLQAEPQTEGHTCGLHALSALYRAHGLDGAALRLRERLGVDVPGVPAQPGTTGTLPPDLLRVLAQDGFRADILGPADPDFAATLDAHLSSHFYALALIKRRENGHLHWVVFTQFENGTVEVADSLRPQEAYLEPVADFVPNHVKSVLLVRPDPNAQVSGVQPAHRRGIWAMLRLSGLELVAVLLLVLILLFFGGELLVLLLWLALRVLSVRNYSLPRLHLAGVLGFATLLAGGLFLPTQPLMTLCLCLAASTMVTASLLCRRQSMAFPCALAVSSLALGIAVGLVLLGRLLVS